MSGRIMDLASLFAIRLQHERTSQIDGWAQLAGAAKIESMTITRELEEAAKAAGQMPMDAELVRLHVENLSYANNIVYGASFLAELALTNEGVRTYFKVNSPVESIKTAAAFGSHIFGMMQHIHKGVTDENIIQKDAIIDTANSIKKSLMSYTPPNNQIISAILAVLHKNDIYDGNAEEIIESAMKIKLRGSLSLKPDGKPDP